MRQGLESHPSKWGASHHWPLVFFLGTGVRGGGISETALRGPPLLVRRWQVALIQRSVHRKVVLDEAQDS